MRIDRLEFTKRFTKAYIKLPLRRQEKVDEALRQALRDVHHPSLRLHELVGEYAGTYPISAGGDLRVHFELFLVDGEQRASLQTVGTHSQLYS